MERRCCRKEEKKITPGKIMQKTANLAMDVEEKR